MKAISIRQPWAWLIVNGHKDVINCHWQTAYRGPLLIHAAKNPDLQYETIQKYYDHIIIPPKNCVDHGGIVGCVELTDCVQSYSSIWFSGPFGLVVRNPQIWPFLPWPGRTGLFEIDDKIRRRVFYVIRSSPKQH